MSEPNEPNKKKPAVGITLGDYNGIGPEIILKALEPNQLTHFCTPIVYGSSKVLNRYRQLLQMKEFPMQVTQNAKQPHPKHVSVINCFPDQQLEVKPGEPTKEAGEAAFQCLRKAVDDLKSEAIDVLVTAPINKETIQSSEFQFPGHTEYLAKALGAKEALMLMVSDRLRVGLLTTHLPLAEVNAAVTRDRLSEKISQILESLRDDFGLNKPVLAVLGLNPHAGENGLLGNEEKEIIAPTLEYFRQKGDLVFGPFPADGFFGSGEFAKYDAVLAMYHDQGLAPFKTLAFGTGVNFTAGLSRIRTSPDHGTAYALAGKNEADPSSMLNAIYLACDIWEYRKSSAVEKSHVLPSASVPPKQTTNN